MTHMSRRTIGMNHRTIYVHLPMIWACRGTIYMNHRVIYMSRRPIYVCRERFLSRNPDFGARFGMSGKRFPAFLTGFRTWGNRRRTFRTPAAGSGKGSGTFRLAFAMSQLLTGALPTAARTSRQRDGTS
jgi:hypothetical protein